MLFNSLEFIYLFMPPVLGVFLILRWLRLETAIIWWLIVASLGFYMWWKPIYVLLLLGSIGFNYLLHLRLKASPTKALFGFGVIFNLGVLALFKYADFLVGNFNALTGSSVNELGLILPLAISFYTFQQISFLHDTLKGNLVGCDFKRYCLFVTFFPQLIAGPIVLQRDTIPQFRLSAFSNRWMLNIAIGATLFCIGLFKKIVLADGIAPVANAVFTLADQGQSVSFEAAWIGALAYTFQIYFDFSGYCDMAIGLARMFGIRLPINFNSPYRAFNIVDFWRRWHIMLSRFLRDYLYIPLGGNRSGLLGRRGNLIITMLLGGLWHGAGWNFVIWGGLHGAYLVLNHAWSTSVFAFTIRKLVPNAIYNVGCWILTFCAVVIAWVFFRAETFIGAILIVQAMLGFAPDSLQTWQQIVPDAANIMTHLTILFVIVLAIPNSIELTRYYRPVIATVSEVGNPKVILNWLCWRPSRGWGLSLSLVALVALIQVYRLNDLTEFIYFNF
ncbi:MAG: MBOAT family protein [Rhizobiaceae bacterium]|nr:MBOAT family protein [Rhizobiaceae bacterium]